MSGVTDKLDTTEESISEFQNTAIEIVWNETESKKKNQIVTQLLFLSEKNINKVQYNLKKKQEVGHFWENNSGQLSRFDKNYKCIHIIENFEES